MEVDSVTAGAVLGARRRQAGGASDRQEAALERGLGAAEGRGVEEGAEAAAARAAEEGRRVERGAQTWGGDEVPPVGLVDRVFELFVREFEGDVDEDRDRVADGDALDVARRADLRLSVQSDPGAVVKRAGWDGDVYRAPAPRTDAPKLGATLVAQLGGQAAREHRPHQLPVTAEFFAADGVDAAVDFVQAACLESLTDGVD